MNPTTALLEFANLLETAHLCALGKTYEKQEELVGQCRTERRAFLASMPVRHRFRCEICGVETAEVELHFEDPKQELSAPAARGMWGTPVGRHFGTDLSSLHSMFAHGRELPEEFADLLHGLCP
jgi:hypothetical protein